MNLPAPSLRRAALAGLLAGLALSLAGALLRLAGIALPVEIGSDRVLPLMSVDQFIFVIGHLGGPLAAKRMALVGGFIAPIAAGSVLAIVYALLLRRHLPARRPLLVLGTLVLAAWAGILLALGPVLGASHLGLPPRWAAVVTAAGLLLELSIFAAVLVAGLRTLEPVPEPTDQGRRHLLLGAAGLVVTIALGGLGRMLVVGSTLGYDGLSYGGPSRRITPTDQFYVVTKNLIDPRVLSSPWRLEVTGRVARPITYELEELKRVDGAVDREITLECIANEVGQGLMSNANWRGLPLHRLLESAGADPSAVGVGLRAVDGYTHTLSLASAMDDSTLVAWAMNGEPLTDHHGFPLRLLVPSAYGEMSVKWLTQISLLDHEEKGYYESQGWQPTFVETTSRIDFPTKGTVLPAGRAVLLSGIAYAARRGISAVEVSTDGGASWAPARIESGQAGTWSLWTLEWNPSGSGAQVLAVRARDGKGELQRLEHRGSVPAGVTGMHRVEVMVSS